jgi:hypothetical protein
MPTEFSTGAPKLPSAAPYLKNLTAYEFFSLKGDVYVLLFFNAFIVSIIVYYISLE